MDSIKDLKAARIMAAPYLSWKRKRMHERYLLTPDHFYLQTLKGIHSGERCFIIGNGPSLRASDLDKLCGEVTFAANRIYDIFGQTDWRPTYYIAVDDRFLAESQNELVKFQLGHKFLRANECTIREKVDKLTRIYDHPLYFEVVHDRYGVSSAYISEDVSDHFCDSGTVTFHAIQLAIYMGFKQIYLIGVDHNYSTTMDTSGKIHVDASVEDHFYSGVAHDFYPASIDNQQNGYCIARDYCDRHGIAIYNATRGGKLEVFERVDLDKIIGTRGGNVKISSYLVRFCYALCAESEAA